MPNSDERCVNCGKIWGDHHDGDFCDCNHGPECDEPRQYIPTPARSEAAGGEELERG